jgi:hypothetical protein
MTRPILPPCSVEGCESKAGAIINEALLCGEHAMIELRRVLKERAGEARNARSDHA